MPELSTRLQKATDSTSFLTQGLAMYTENKYNGTDNPDGIINFGTAENKLMHSEIHQRISTVELSKMPISLAQYNNFTGNNEFRDYLSKFMNHYMKPTIEIQPSNLVVYNGCGPAVEGLGFCLCDAEEGILVPTPYYGCFKSDLKQRSHVKLCEFKFPEEHRNNADIITKTLQKSLESWQEQGIRVKALLICNPDNPTGTVYNLKEVEVMLEFCLANNIHAIIDEVYFFSVFDEDVTMQSVLALPNFEKYKDIVQTLWAFSKDFSLSGFRCGVLVTYNKELYDGICQISLYSASSSVSQHIIQHLINDFDWVDQFVATNHKRLRKSLEIALRVLHDLEIPYVKPSAGLYVWFNLNKYIRGQPCEEKDKEMFFKLLENGVYVAPGFAFYSDEPGWFRIIFSLHCDELTLGMNRFRKVLLELGKNDDTDEINNDMKTKLDLNNNDSELFFTLKTTC